ncbi:MAG: hypothetical protein JWO30_4996 [Fibrobacteres bacterium]|nr:hypothetical protein [Fibrobacterota bacterium]
MASTLEEEIELLTSPLIRSPSISEEGMEVTEEFNDLIEDHFEPLSTGWDKKKIKLDLYKKVYKFLSDEDLTGEERLQIMSSFSNAILFADTLPSTIHTPEISVDIDFGVIFDWTLTKFKTFSVSIGKGNYLNYAAIYGQSVHHGKELLGDKFPDSFDLWIKRIF